MIQQPKQTVDSKVIAALISPVQKPSDSDKIIDVACSSASGLPLSTSDVVPTGATSKNTVKVDVAQHILRLEVEPPSASTSPTGNEKPVVSPVQSSATLVNPVISPVQQVSSTTPHIQNSEHEKKKSETKHVQHASSTKPEQNTTNDALTPSKEDEMTENSQVSGVDAESTEESVLCCDNQDCGVTVMPGKHENYSTIFVIYEHRIIVLVYHY